MTHRLPFSDGSRGTPIEIQIGGSSVRAYQAESVAAAAIASGTRVLSRSLKYHRPRSFFCLEGHCSGCLMRIDGIPNVRACQTPCRPGTVAAAQNAFPSAEIDLLGAVDFLFTRGLDQHTLMTRSSTLNMLANKVVRQLSGLGTLPDRATGSIADVVDRTVDVCVIGGGPAGLAAATACAHAGLRTLLVDDQLRLGGSLRADTTASAGSADAKVADAIAAGVEPFERSTAIGYFPDDGGVLAIASPSHLARVHARGWIWATGAYAVNLPFDDNDRPGVIAARAVARLLVDHHILAGERVCIVENPQLEKATTSLATALSRAGAEVVRVAAEETFGAKGRGWVSSVETARGRIDCDLVAVAAIPAPASEGARQQGCKVVLDPAAGGFRVVTDANGQATTANTWACGDVTGYLGPERAADDGLRVGRNVIAELGK